MGGKFYGADVAELRRVADAFDKAAGDLNDATQTVTRSVQSTFWAGPVAVKFRTTWTEQHCMRLGSAREALREQAKQLRTQAQEQQDTSTADTGDNAAPGAGAAMLFPIPILPRNPFFPEPRPPAALTTDLEIRLWRKMQAGMNRSGLTEAQIVQEISQLAEVIDKADEPYRSLFFEHVDKIGFAYSKGENGVYRAAFDTIYIDYSKHIGLPPGDNESLTWTLLHEFGHAIDDKEVVFENATKNWEMGGKSLYDTLHGDVKSNVTNWLADPKGGGLTQSQAENVAKLIMEGKASSLTGAEATAFANAKTFYRGPNMLGRPEARSVSDIYGGYTYNELFGNYGHWDSNNDGIPDSDYWTGWLGGPSHKQEVEYWADFYADKMVYRYQRDQLTPPPDLSSTDQETWRHEQTNTYQGERFFPGGQIWAEQMAERARKN